VAERPRHVRRLPSDLPWKVLSSETVLDSSWLRVHRQRVRTAPGYELPEYYVIDAPDIVILLALTGAGQVVLVDQYRHGIARNMLELPAGLVETTDTSPALAAERELLEETGYRAGRLEPLAQLFPSPARQSNVTHCFLALDCHQVAVPAADPAENISLRLLPLRETRAAAIRGQLASQTSVACLFLGLDRLSELGLG
jgi:8-oxo-dGTP pyrophosphatase MutT (NUDIX family)